jgi:hypothetical protein
MNAPDALTVLRELATHRASTRLMTSDDARAILDHITALTAERDAAEEGARAWREVGEGIEAHLQDRVAMNDAANPASYLSIVRLIMANAPKAAQQLLAGRYIQYADVMRRAESAEAERDAAVAEVAQIVAWLRSEGETWYGAGNQGVAEIMQDAADTIAAGAHKGPSHE